MSVKASHTMMNGMPLMTCPLHPMQAANASYRVDFIAVHWCALRPVTCTLNVTGNPLQSTKSVRALLGRKPACFTDPAPMISCSHSLAILTQPSSAGIQQTLRIPHQMCKPC